MLYHLLVLLQGGSVHTRIYYPHTSETVLSGVVYRDAKSSDRDITVVCSLCRQINSDTVCLSSFYRYRYRCLSSTLFQFPRPPSRPSPEIVRLSGHLDTLYLPSVFGTSHFGLRGLGRRVRYTSYYRTHGRSRAPTHDIFQVVYLCVYTTVSAAFDARAPDPIPYLLDSTHHSAQGGTADSSCFLLRPSFAREHGEITGERDSSRSVQPLMYQLLRGVTSMRQA